MSHDKKEKKPAISFYSKKKVKCPYCRKEFKREELLSGGGRMIAGELTDELRRTYEPSAKFGMVYPLLYSVVACPNCHASMLWSDFKVELSHSLISTVMNDESERKTLVKEIFPYYDLNRPRSLLDGAAMYYLALLCYEKMPASHSPTIKKAQICLRLAWLCGDLHREAPHRGYDFIQMKFYHKALFFYQESIEFETNRVESITSIGNFGPDIDKNYGYDGVIYLCGLLEYKYGQKENIEERLNKLDASKRAIARIFGLGKSTKAKPGPLLEHSRNLYDNITATLKDASTPDLDFGDDE